MTLFLSVSKHLVGNIVISCKHKKSTWDSVGFPDDVTCER